MMHFIQAIVAGALNLIIQILPVRLACLVARGLGDIIYVISFKRRKVAMANVEKAFGPSFSVKEKRQVVRGCFQNTALSIMDLFIVNKIKSQAEQLFEVQGLENYKSALQGGRGVVLVTSHLGSWENLAFLFYLTKTQGSVVVKKMANHHVDYRVNEARRQTGLHPISKKNSIREVLKELHANHTVAILIDQWAGREGIWQKFFGQYTSTTSLPARLLNRTGCALLPAFCLRGRNGKFEIKIYPPLMPAAAEKLSDAAITKKLNDILESEIRQHPRQWSWAHRRWKSKPAETR